MVRVRPISHSAAHTKGVTIQGVDCPMGCECACVHMFKLQNTLHNQRNVPSVGCKFENVEQGFCE